MSTHPEINLTTGKAPQEEAARMNPKAPAGTTDAADPAATRTEADWDTAADWAQTATFTADDFIAAESDPLGPHAGADLLRRAGVGRPPLDPATPAGQSSRSRPVRLGRDLDHQLEDYLAELATAGKRTNASEIIRAALQVYLADHGTRQHTA